MERNEALVLGLRTYDTGRTCRNGHLAERLTSSGTCMRCAALARDASRAKSDALIAEAKKGLPFQSPSATAYMDRSEAINNGFTRYFTGRPCQRGHVADRYTKSGNCAACLLENLQAINADVKELKHKFMENTELIFLHVYDVDFDTVKIFVSSACHTNLEIGMKLFMDSFTRVRSVAGGVSQCSIRVPLGIKSDIYKLASAFLQQHSKPVVVPTVTSV